MQGGWPEMLQWLASAASSQAELHREAALVLLAALMEKIGDCWISKVVHVWGSTALPALGVGGSKGDCSGAFGQAELHRGWGGGGGTALVLLAALERI